VAKKLYYDRRILNSENKMKNTWNIIKTVTGKKESKEDIQYLNIKGNTTSNQQILANKFDDYFLTISSKVSKTGQPVHDNYLNYMPQTYKGPLSNIQFRHTSTHEIEEIIKSLKAKHSYGYDEIPATILKVSVPFISSPLTYTVNKSLSSGIFPTRLKFSVVKPVFKNGDKQHF
jgi:hypothetical protein